MFKRSITYNKSFPIKKNVDYETKLSNSLAHLIDKGGGRGGGLIPSGRN